MSDVTPGPADDYRSSPSYRGAKAAVIILGALLLIGFGLLIVGFAMKASGHGPGAASNAPVRFTLPPGAKIVSTETTDNRLILHVHSVAGDEIDIIDTGNGRLIGQVKTPSSIKAK